MEVNTVLHGFAGYFETVLYQDITLSEFGALDGGYEHVLLGQLMYIFH